MGKRKFEAMRFALFTKSYAGYYFAQYIKASENTDILTKKLAKILLLQEKSLQYFLFNKGSKIECNEIIKKFTDDKDKIKIYLKIEKQLTTLIQGKKDEDSNASEEYEKALLGPAIERVSGDTLAHIKSDYEFEKELIERKRIYNHWYYIVAYKYRLPTLRIIPFISRLLKNR